MKEYPGANYSFRPISYWHDQAVLESLLRDLKGQLRRDVILGYWNSGQFELLNEELVDTTISPELRARLGRIRPAFLGGEYLPDPLPTDTEIARISLRSTTSDVISVRAGRDCGRS